jgi:hypothetical protein
MQDQCAFFFAAFPYPLTIEKRPAILFYFPHDGGEACIGLAGVNIEGSRLFS